MQEQQSSSERTAEEPSPDATKVDIAALTRAVERLLRRDLEIAQERLHGLGGGSSGRLR